MINQATKQKALNMFQHDCEERYSKPECTCMVKVVSHIVDEINNMKSCMMTKEHKEEFEESMGQ